MNVKHGVDKNRVDILKRWLENNGIKYFESKEGLISVDLKHIPNHLFSEYHSLCYQTQKLVAMEQKKLSPGVHIKGDIQELTFTGPEPIIIKLGLDHALLKPGDTVMVKDGTIYINGKVYDPDKEELEDIRFNPHIVWVVLVVVGLILFSMCVIRS